MLGPAIAVGAIIAWMATAAVSVADLFGDGPRTGRVAGAGMVLAAVTTTACVVVNVAQHGLEGFVGKPHLFAFLAAVVGLGAVLARRRLALRGANALVAPFGAVLVACYALAPSRLAGADAELLPLLVVHIGLVLVGVGTFALAAMSATLYLVQERQLRQRSFGPLFHRLPSLEELDTASFRLVVWGFVAYTAGLALGFAWTAYAHAGAANARVALAVAAWVVFAAVIHTRVTTGWRGKQSAVMTIGGCVATYAVLAGYLIR